jgi:dTDP-glucose 4,6-dehydratase
MAIANRQRRKCVILGVVNSGNPPRAAPTTNVRLIVTGGTGFIGSAVIRHHSRRGWTIANIDKLTYAGNLESPEQISASPRHIFLPIDGDAAALTETFRSFMPDAVLHLESHVDRSIDSAAPFIETNIKRHVHA